MIAKALRRLQRLTGTRYRKSLILMYHRIDDPPVDPWGLCVTPEIFAEQMGVLARLGVACRLSEVQQQGGRVAVTFDDGYADNLYQAKHVLQQFNIPATVFVVTGAAGTGGFWWDEIERLILHVRHLPRETLALQIAGQEYRWDLAPEDLAWSPEQMVKFKTWIAWRDDPPTSRHSLFRAIWEALRGIEHVARAQQLESIRDWAQAPNGPTHMRPMNREELRSLSAGGLVELGAHSVTHSRLSALSPNAQSNEIFESRDWLAEVAGQPIPSFSFPFGGQTDYTPVTVGLLRSAGFTQACTTAGSAVHQESDPYQLPRVHVENWGADRFSAWLLQHLRG